MSYSMRRSGKGETILVCDDDTVVLKATACLLETNGYSVIRACSAAEAIDASESLKETISLVLTDVTMPDMNGYELVQRLLQHRPRMKVIYMSGYSEDIVSDDGSANQKIEFLRKPTASDTLFEHVRRVLDSVE